MRTLEQRLAALTARHKAELEQEFAAAAAEEMQRAADEGREMLKAELRRLDLPAWQCELAMQKLDDMLEPMIEERLAKLTRKQ